MRFIQGLLAAGTMINTDQWKAEPTIGDRYYTGITTPGVTSYATDEITPGVLP
jgi:hypothetical protein